MKKCICCLIVLLALCFINVEAEDYQVNSLIPVDTTATVNTEKFSYIDFIYHSQIDNKGNASIDFNSIKNNTHSKTAVSINILLFDGDKKNVGFLTYCSDKDLSSGNYGFKLLDGESKPFNIAVVKKYFADKKSASDVKFIAVMDENKYCQIGGYDKYAGSSIEDIISGEAVKREDNKLFDLDVITSIMKNKKIINTALYIFILFIVLLIIGGILNNLYRKMFNKTTELVYVPIVNVYICFKLAFGDLIALILTVLFLISLGLLALGINIIAIALSIIFGFALLIVIIKIVSKKYELFYFGLNNNNGNNKIKIGKEKNQSNKKEENIETEPKKSKPLDLSYKDKPLVEDKSASDDIISNLYQTEEVSADNSNNKFNFSKSGNPLNADYNGSENNNDDVNETIINSNIEEDNKPLEDLSNPFDMGTNIELDDDNIDDDDSLFDSINDDSDDDFDDGLKE